MAEAEPVFIPDEAIQIEGEGIRHNCAIVGVIAPEGDRDIVSINHSVLFDSQHRGHEGSGMVSMNGDQVVSRKGEGWVKHAITKEDIEAQRAIRPTVSLGQNRYSTQGSDNGRGALQPFEKNGIAFVHNGTYSNGRIISEAVRSNGYKGEVHSDSHAAFLLVDQQKGGTIEEKFVEALPALEPAFSVIMAGEGKLIAARDYMGVRPLSIGVLPENGGYVVVSETSSFGNIHAELVRHVEPGEVVVIDESGVNTFYKDPRAEKEKRARCSFEDIYIAAPDALFGDRLVVEVRHALGREMAIQDRKNGFKPEIVIPVLNSGLPYAIGYHEEMGGQMREALIANAYIGRTFTEPNNRDIAARRKHRGTSFGIEDKIVVLVDDSVVRGNTMEQFAEVLREHPKLIGRNGPREIHLRSCSPQIIDFCHLGVDMAEYKDDLIAVREDGDVEKIASSKKLDSVRFATNEMIIRAIRGNEFVSGAGTSAEMYRENGLCGGCFTGEHPVRTDQTFGKIRNRENVPLSVNLKEGVEVKL